MIQDRRTKGSHATTTIHGHKQLTGPGTYVYDGNGNPTTFGGTALTWDVENRMTAHGTAFEAAYRGDGLRAWKEGSTRTYFLYDGINVVCELDAVGDLLAASTFGAAGLISRGAVQYQFDPLGDAVHLLDATGDVTANRLFDAWGNELTSGDFDPRGYQAKYGYYTDEETGLIALAYRYYAPGVGRFLNRDPIGYEGGVNVFGYAHGNPASRTDSSGMTPAIVLPSIEDE
ncbi:MAG: RHS repeat-associated core domain-containing protein [Fimbriimonadaceae bacterium]|nr:RHS repeat-associated core domain-containing protein [Fimbriimonadaceae bacterium]